MGATDANGRPFTPAELQAQKAGLQALQFRLLQHRPEAFSIPFLCQAHAQLTGGVQKLSPGQLRTGDITFGSYYGTRPDRIRPELDQLIQTHHERWPQAVEDGDTIRHAIWVHAELIRIHPMHDGNGRLARAMEAWLCWQAGERAPTYPDRTQYYAGIGKYCLYGDLRALQTAASFD